MSNHQRGYTLIEVLCFLFVLGFVAVSVWVAVRSLSLDHTATQKTLSNQIVVLELQLESDSCSVVLEDIRSGTYLDGKYPVVIGGLGEQPKTPYIAVTPWGPDYFINGFDSRGHRILEAYVSSK